MLFGPSMLGNKNILGQALFPVKGVVVVEKVASFGLMFFFFMTFFSFLFNLVIFAVNLFSLFPKGIMHFLQTFFYASVFNHLHFACLVYRGNNGVFRIADTN